MIQAIDARSVRRAAVLRAQDYWKRELVGYDVSGNFLSRVPSASDYTEFDLQMLAFLEDLASDDEIAPEVKGIADLARSLTRLHNFVAASKVAFMWDRQLLLLREHMTDVVDGHWRGESNVADDEVFWTTLCDAVASVSLGRAMPVETIGL